MNVKTSKPPSIGGLVAAARRFWRVSATLGSLLATALLAACGGEDKPEGKPAAGLSLTDANNYSATNVLHLPTISFSNAAGTQVCWDQLTRDLQCQTMTPQEVESLTFLRFSGRERAAIEEMLAAGKLVTSQINEVYTEIVDTTATSGCIPLSGLSVYGSEPPAYLEIPVEADPSYTYVIVYQTGTNPGVNSRTMAFLEPSTEATAATTILAPDGCVPGAELLDFAAYIDDAAVPLPVPTTGPWVVDWLGVTTDGLGYDVPYTGVDGFLVGFYQGKNVDEIEQDFLNLRNIATQLYEGPVELTSPADLGTAVSTMDGVTPFPGFNQTDGVWLFALLCSECQNPSPVALTVLQPGAAQ